MAKSVAIEVREEIMKSVITEAVARFGDNPTSIAISIRNFLLLDYKATSAGLDMTKAIAYSVAQILDAIPRTLAEKALDCQKFIEEQVEKRLADYIEAQDKIASIFIDASLVKAPNIKNQD